MGIKKLIVLTLISIANSDGLSDDNKEWKLFKITYSKIYSTQNEEAQRMEIFLKNLQLVAKHNEKYDKGEVSFTTKINEYSDWSYEEISLHRKGYRPSLRDERIKDILFSPQAGITLPADIDWRQKGAVTPIKDQGDCGSCWAFSAVGSLEGQHFLKYNKLVPLSEQDVVDCAPCNGCAGGEMGKALSYVQANKGIDTEESYPYTAKQGKCKFSPNTIGATVKGVVRIPSGNESALQVAVATIGPVSVAFDASGPAFGIYKGGLYTNPNCSSSIQALDHGILVVGYGSTKDGQDYWLLKNSWGTNWGMQGYFMSPRNQNNMCGIATDAVYPVV